MRKTIYISDDYKIVQQVAQEKGKNFSRYICELVTRDVESQNNNQYELLIDEVKELKSLLVNHSVTIPVPQPPQIVTEERARDKQKEEEMKRRERSKKLNRNALKF